MLKNEVFGRSGGGVQGFFKRRLNRILLPSICVSVPWFFLIDVIKGKNWVAFLLDTTGLNLFVTGDRSDWFIRMILLCYLIFPYIYNYYEKNEWGVKALLKLLLGVIVFNFILSQTFEKLWINSEILWRRFLVFFIGCYFGKFVYEKKEVNVNRQIVVLGSVVGLCLLIYINYIMGGNLNRYREIVGIVSISTVFLISIIGEIGFIKRLFIPVSTITLEVYLVHGKMIMVISTICPIVNDVLVNVIAFVGTFIVAFVLKYFTDRVNIFLKTKYIGV